MCNDAIEHEMCFGGQIEVCFWFMCENLNHISEFQCDIGLCSAIFHFVHFSHRRVPLNHYIETQEQTKLNRRKRPGREKVEVSSKETETERERETRGGGYRVKVEKEPFYRTFIFIINNSHVSICRVAYMLGV